MSAQPFDREAAAKKLLAREMAEREVRESIRKELLIKCETYLRSRFLAEGIGVYLVGSITQPYAFHVSSDIDIVLKGFQGDRFDIWTELEKAINHRIEVIIFEACNFQDHIVQYGKKVV